MNARYDALIVGGGPSGATAAILLARAGWSVAVLERKVFPRGKVCGEYLSATNRPLLQELGLARCFESDGGPEVRRVGLFAGRHCVEAPLAHPSGGWGRAWPRTDLDTRLLHEAEAAGADVIQPAVVTRVDTFATRQSAEVRESNWSVRKIHATIVIGAHGSWDTGTLPTQPGRRRCRAGDLLAFKAHFRGHALCNDLMPLVCFPGGYGGMVNCGHDCLSFSLCIRRDRLSQIRGHEKNAGIAILRYVMENCVGVRRVLQNAALEDGWLAAGPIRPGIRLPRHDEYFAIGNAAGEAHPVVAEGISMSLQSAWLLSGLLVEWRRSGADRKQLHRVQAEYARSWRKAFAMRVWTAAAVAHWAMRPLAVRSVLPLLRACPALLTMGSRWSGKSTMVQPASSRLVAEKSPA